MKEEDVKHLSRVAGVWLVVLALAVAAWAQEVKPVEEAKPAVAGAEVTLKGVMMTEVSCTPKPAKRDDKKLVLFAVEGPPKWPPPWTPS